MSWWWHAGGVWYFYAAPVEGTPGSVSDITVEGEATGKPSPAPEEPHKVFNYRPGDRNGVAYETIEDCSQARQQDGGVGVCVVR